ncbi:MAG: CoA-disulfide reductase [Verrucomicrobiales bacterium VVV1]|nr:MAG: CoA-disulfide reductase [Verrucomicrobiales bacterium VVV1]
MSTHRTKTIVIVGGVAGGASCATRLRRMDEEAEIIVFERGPYASFANCGLPYHIGGIIENESDLLVAKGPLFKERYGIDLRTRHEVVSIDREAREVEIRDLDSDRIYRQAYDALVLSPGAAPLRPPLPGIDLPGIFTVRNIPDARMIRSWIEQRSAKKAVIVGGGFIGLEMAENLRHLGLEVTLVEMLPQVMPPMDVEMISPVHDYLESKGIKLVLGAAVAGFAEQDGELKVQVADGRYFNADLVILAIGVRPEASLAKEAGLTLGERGGIRVDEQMRTSDLNIWAVGDAVEVHDRITGAWTLLALAGPANRQGRIAADAICGRPVAFHGTQGTAVCGIFDLAVASTGASEKALVRAGMQDFEKLYLHAGSHAGYYPGATRIHFKLIFRKTDGLILGAQAVGMDGVDKRIDVLAMAIQKGASVHDLEEAELCYAPQFGSAKDPINFAGMIAANHLRGDDPLLHWLDAGLKDFDLLDVRDEDEFAEGHVPGALNIPLNSLRDSLSSLGRVRPLAVYCAVGGRAHNAVRLLRQKGFEACNVSGGYLSYRHVKGIQTL